MKRYILICLLILCFVGCNVREKKNTQEKKIFSFPIGYDKEELGLLPEKSANEVSLDFCYSNGFFYISDKINNKILKVTETGVVVLTIYNQGNYPHLKVNKCIRCWCCSEVCPVSAISKSKRPLIGRIIIKE